VKHAAAQLPRGGGSVARQADAALGVPAQQLLGAQVLGGGAGAQLGVKQAFCGGVPPAQHRFVIEGQERNIHSLHDGLQEG
jgi:hypothetical protein